MKAGEKLEEIQRETYQEEGKEFPSSIYSDLVLSPGFEHAVKFNLYDLRQINIAHLVMLTEENLIDQPTAKSIMQALLSIDYAKYGDMKYTGEYEDLYFTLEAEIIRIVGPRGGLLHLARSRNDIDTTLQRMLVKKNILKVMQGQERFLKTILAFAEAYKDVPTIEHTHTQQAQPSVIGHYFLAAFSLVYRDYIRLLHAYETTDCCPMGAAAITTSGFAINRERVAELLGFAQVQENSYDSIGGADFILEYANALQLAAIDLGKMTFDLLSWATQEYGILKVDDAFIQVSSIMPQKRNPVALEHSRAFLSSVVGECGTMTTMLHNTPYGDINDQEDDMVPFITDASDRLEKVYHLLSSVIATMKVNTKILTERLENSFCVITELADTIVRNEDISFREAHSVASKLVSYCTTNDIKLSGVSFELIKGIYEETLKIPMKGSKESVLTALTAKNFIEKRTVEGGIALKPMLDMIGHSTKKLDDMNEWMAKRKVILQAAADTCEEEARKIAAI